MRNDELPPPGETGYYMIGQMKRHHINRVLNQNLLPLSNGFTIFFFFFIFPAVDDWSGEDIRGLGDIHKKREKG